MEYNIAVIPGDGIGVDVIREAVRVLDKVGEAFGHTFHYEYRLVGGCCIDKYGVPIQEETLRVCEGCDAILFGAAGGPQWDHLPREQRPERGLAALRRHFELFCNLRPAKLYDAIRDASPLNETLVEQGFDLMLIRDLIGGIYFGEKGTRQGKYGPEAYDVECYSAYEAERVARRAFAVARQRGNQVTSIDKSNALESSRLWRDTVTRVHDAEFADVRLDHLLVDQAALELVRRLTVKGAIGCIMEFYGDGVAALSVSERQTIANMTIEMGATTGVFPSDAETLRFLTAQQRGEDYLPLAADPGCVYDRTLTVDLAALEPLVAEPSMPDKVRPARECAAVKPVSVFIGSCTNASYSDIARAAAALKGRKVHPDVDCTVAPGSRQVLAQLLADGVIADLVASGARILECACGPCIGVGQIPAYHTVSVRTSNRNFPGRCSSNDAGVYLASPETAAATAVTGHITDPRDLMDVSVLAAIREPDAWPIDDSAFIRPSDIPDPQSVQVVKGPNISELPMRGPLRETIEAGVVLKLGDNVTTDDIIPGGSAILKYISNIPEFAKYTFCYTDPDFVRRARELSHSVIVGGENYGQGSSREHAAMLPMYLGTEAVLAKSYARIHKENLINYGILPLLFEDAADYEKLEQDDALVIERTREGVRSGRFLVRVPAKGIPRPAGGQRRCAGGLPRGRHRDGGARRRGLGERSPVSRRPLP